MKQIQIVNTKTNEAKTFDNQADADAYISEHAVGNFVATKTYQAKVFGVKRINYTIAFSEVSANRQARRSFEMAVLAEGPNMFAHFHKAVVATKRTKDELIRTAIIAGVDEGLNKKDKKDVLINKIALALAVKQGDHILATVEIDHSNLHDAITSLRDIDSWMVVA